MRKAGDAIPGHTFPTTPLDYDDKSDDMNKRQRRPSVDMMCGRPPTAAAL